MKNNKKGAVATIILIVIGFFALILLGLYAGSYLPIPALKPLRNTIHYVLIIFFFIILQIAIILGYYYAGKYAVKGFRIYRNKIQKTLFDIRAFIITKGR